MVLAKVWVKAREHSGDVSLGDFRLEEEELPALNEGDVLFEALCLTVDPYMRVYTWMSPVGQKMAGGQVSRHGWRTHTVCTAVEMQRDPKNPLPLLYPLPELRGMPISYGVGVIGMPGATAYVGLLDKGQPKPGDVVLVNGAAGAVGSIAGQIAKIKGCTVIGYAGSDEKVKWIKEELGFDFAFNYKKVELSESLKQAAPDGVDVYYDNVGGSFSDTVISNHMKMFGRVVFIGNISNYNTTGPPQGPQLYDPIRNRHLTVYGMIISNEPKARWYDGFRDMVQWIQEGKLKYREHITTGFDQMPQAFMGLFKGENIGKAVVKI